MSKLEIAEQSSERCRIDWNIQQASKILFVSFQPLENIVEKPQGVNLLDSYCRYGLLDIYDWRSEFHYCFSITNNRPNVQYALCNDYETESFIDTRELLQFVHRLNDVFNRNSNHDLLNLTLNRNMVKVNQHAKYRIMVKDHFNSFESYCPTG